MTKNIEICKAEEVGAQVLDILGTTAERQAVAAINAAFGLAIPLPANEPGEITELPAAVSAHDRQLLAQLLGKPEPAATLSTTDPLATFVATLTRELYLHFADRQAVYPLADFPAWFPHDDRNLAHLLQAVQSLSPRKISNGSATNDGLPDGISLAHILGHRSMVTKIDDDNHGWICDSVMPNFPNLGDATLRMDSITVANALNNLGATGKVTLAGTKTITSGASQYNDPMPLNATEIIADEVTASDAIFSQKSYPNLQKVSMKKVRSLNGRSFYDLQAEGPLKEVYLPELRTYDTWAFLLDYSGTRDKYLSLILLEIGSDVSCNISNWNPTNALSSSASDLVADPTAHPTWKNLDQFLQNFRDHIALRLTDQGSGLTLTLSQAVRNAIHAAESTYGIEDIIVNQKHWTLSPAPSA